LKVTGTTANRTDWSSFTPDPRVGAGAASYSTNQIVNFLQFGRCFDVTHQDLTSATMIIYPCKQDPGPTHSDLTWNQKWYYTEPNPLVGSVAGQQIKVVNGSNYCLTAPTLASGSIYPTMSLCSSSPDQLWTRWAKADTYANSWLFKDSHNRCIGLGGLLNATSDPWNQMTVATCTGGPEQKWNAPPAAQSASLDNFKELN
jgi:hypothetical protein